MNTVAFHLVDRDEEFLDRLALPSADAVPASTPLQGSAAAARDRAHTCSRTPT